MSKNLKTLLLSMAVSDLDVGLLTQPMGTLDSRTQTKGRKWVSFELSKFILGSEAAGNKIEKNWVANEFHLNSTNNKRSSS